MHRMSCDRKCTSSKLIIVCIKFSDFELNLIHTKIKINSVLYFLAIFSLNSLKLVHAIKSRLKVHSLVHSSLQMPNMVALDR